MLIAKPPLSNSIQDTVVETLWRASGTYGNPGINTPSNPSSATVTRSSKDNYVERTYDTEYRKKLVQGRLLPMTPWVKYSSEFVWVSGQLDCSFPTTSPYYRYWIKNSPGFWSWWNNQPNPPWHPVRSNYESLAQGLDYDYYVQAVAARIYSNGWDALTFTAELTKTVAMFRGFVGRVIRQASSPKGLASLWLEGRYGWRTLAYDLIDIDKAIRNLDDGRKRFRDRVGGNTSETITNQWTNGAAWGTLTCTAVVNRKIGVRGTIVADIELPRFGFNPVTTAWELITLSFVIDWIVNVGQFLEAMSFLALSRAYVAAGGIMIQDDIQQTSSFAKAANVNPGSWYLNTAAKATFIRRIPSAVDPIPLPKLRLGAFKVADLVALALQAVYGKLRNQQGRL